MQSVVAKGRLSRLTLIFFTYAVGMQRVRIKTVYYRVTSLPPVNLVGLGSQNESTTSLYKCTKEIICIVPMYRGHTQRLFQ